MSTAGLGTMSVLLTLMVILASFAVNMTFGQSPIILAQVTRSSSDLLTVGDSGFSLSCTVASDLEDPLFTYQWWKDGEVMSHTEKILSLSPLKATTAGAYNCHANVSSSSLSLTTIVDSCNTEVLSLQLPTPTSGYINYINANTRSNVTLNCNVEFDLSLDIPVTVNTVWTGPAGFMTTNTAQSSSLNIYISTTMVSSHEKQQSGVYTCTATVISTSPSLPLRNSIEYTSVKAIAGVYLLLNKVIYPNNSIISITEIGQSSNNKALQCVTDNISCCRTTRTGEWFFPESGETVPIEDFVNTTTFYRNRRNDGTVNLNRVDNNVTTPTGKFCCVVPDVTNTNVTVCANIALELPAVQVTINFKLTSSQDSLVITFSLTCNSTGGPVSSVTWTRDGLLLENTGPLVQTDSSSASYTNILRVSGRTLGTYTCHMRGMDNQVLLGAMDFTVFAAPLPVNIQATRTSASAPVEVSWSPPRSDHGAIAQAAITGYRIFYGEGESILVPLYVTRILLNVIETQDEPGQSVSIRSESMKLPSELIEVHIKSNDDGMSTVSSLSCSTQVGTAVGVILLLVGLLAVVIVSTLVLIFCWWRKKFIPSKNVNEFSKAANMAYGEVRQGSEGRGDDELYEEPNKIDNNNTVVEYYM